MGVESAGGRAFRVPAIDSIDVLRTAFVAQVGYVGFEFGDSVGLHSEGVGRNFSIVLLRSCGVLPGEGDQSHWIFASDTWTRLASLLVNQQADFLKKTS